MTPDAYGIYIHIPFCRHRCAYCDFNTYAGQAERIPAYVEALLKEIDAAGRQAGMIAPPIRVQSVFLGGGTPSLLTGRQIGSILGQLRSRFLLTDDAEITIEANPGTVQQAALQAYRQAGVNRISYGVQSANAEELRMLEREHTFFEVIEAVAEARKAGIDNINLDLIYGLPQQSLSTWKTTLARILDLHPEHISAYALTLEHGTPFGRWSRRGLIPGPDPDLAADMYEWTRFALSEAGFNHYEISNWCLPGRSCRHNLQYWQGDPYLGFGAGAHGYAGGFRYSNLLRIGTYIDRLKSNPPGKTGRFPLTPAVVNQHRQSGKDEISDYMINNLRLVEQGVDESKFRRRFGCGIREIFDREISQSIAAGLLEAVETDGSMIYRLTSRGLLLGNRVFGQFV